MIRALPLLLACAMLGACDRRLTVPNVDPDLREALEGSHRRDQEQLWKRRHERGTLPDLEGLPPLNKEMQQRRRPQIPVVDPVPPADFTPFAGEMPMIEVIVADPEVRSYKGVLVDPVITQERVIRKDENEQIIAHYNQGKITARLAGSGTAITVHFRTPTASASLDHGGNTDIENYWLLDWEESVVDGSRHERFQLSTDFEVVPPHPNRQNGIQVQLASFSIGDLSDAFSTDWTMRSGEVLHIRQQAPGPDGIAPVGILLGADPSLPRHMLLPGANRNVLGFPPSAGLNVIVISSAVQPESDRVAKEGNTAYVSLYFYRLPGTA